MGAVIFTISSCMQYKKLLSLVVLSLFFCTTYGQRVTEFRNMSREGDQRLFRRDYVKLTVEQLDSLKKKAGQDKIILYIDDVPFEDLVGEFADSATVTFKFEKSDNSDNPEAKAWAFFYKKPRKWILQDKKISVGIKGQHAVPSTATIDIVIIQSIQYWLGILLIALLLALLIWLSVSSNLLRDTTGTSTIRPPYSLARTQFTFWLMLISSAYIFLWISTGEMPVLTSSTLILLGISGGTSVIAKIIDNSQSLYALTDDKTDGFFIDILSDEKGISVHRLQMVVFTLIVGLIYCYDVIVIFEMPEFDNNLLMLMGISSGAYAGLKSTEHSSTTPVG